MESNMSMYMTTEEIQRKIYKGNTLVSAYEYDELSQLILEYDAVRGTETYYTYDNGGNILNRTVLDSET